MTRKKQAAQTEIPSASPQLAIDWTGGQTLLEALRRNQWLLGELAVRYEVETHPERPTGELPAISSPEDVRRLLAPEMTQLAQEQLRVLLLNTRNQVLGQRVIYQGNVCASIVRPAEVLRPAVIVQVPPLSEGKLYPKEQALLDLVAAERLAGRRVLVYATHTGSRDITGRMDDILTRHGLKVAVMKADAVAPDRREAWVADRVKQGVDVLICHPRLVQTGLDLIDFPTLLWYETDYSVYTMRQASRRSWRIGQTRPVKVVFMSYRNSLQADALKLVAKKLQSSLAVEGELPEDGLAAYGDDGDDLMLALARKIVSGEEDDEAETVEAVFAQARDAENAAEELLVDDGWKAVEVEPEPVAVNGNGHHADGVGPSVELVMGNGHAAVPVNGNGHRDEAPETQQTLFSWAEFMAEEPVKPKARSRKPKPSSTSLFDWALNAEQEREKEKEVAGAER